MADIKCPADCLFAVNGNCASKTIELSYGDYGHTKCEMQLEKKISNVGHGYSADLMCAILPGMTAKEIFELMDNTVAMENMNNKQKTAICELLNCLIKNGR